MQVTYDIQGFLLKNRDALNPDVANTFAQSKNPLLMQFFRPVEEPAGTRDGKLTVKTLKKALHQTSVASQFQVRAPPPPAGTCADVYAM